MDEPTTRCKFRVTGVTLGVPGAGARIRLEAMYPSDADGYKHGEDHAFFSATPSGFLEMTVNNPYGAEFFEPGEFVYLDFSHAPNPLKQPQAA